MRKKKYHVNICRRISVDKYSATESKPEMQIMKDSEEMPAALNMLKAAGIPARRMDYDYVEHGGTHDAALQLGVDEHAVVKSLVFDNGKQGEERQAVMVLMHGDERVSLRRLERLSGIRRLSPSSPDTARELTGYLPGGICPFGLKTPLPLFMQETLDELPELFVNAGRRGVVVAVSPDALAVLSPVRGDLVSMAQRRV